MANQTILVYGTQKTLTSTGSSVTNGQLSSAAGTTYSQTDTSDYPDAVFTLDVGTMSASATAGNTIDVYIRPLDVDGTTDTPAPLTGASTDAYKGKYICSFTMKAASTGVYATIGYDIPRAGEAYIYNGSGVTVANSGNWTLKMTPRTYGPSA